MKFIRYLDPANQVHFAEEITSGLYHTLSGDPYTGFQKTTQPAAVHQLLAPIVPAQILCIGLNYRRHAEETNAKIPQYPILFTKGVNTFQHPGQPIELPRHLCSDEVDYECELAVVIGRSCKNISIEKALQFVLGYTCANDVSARDWQIARGGSQWCRGKTFDTFSPLGPCLVTSDSIPNPQTLGIRTVINGETLQDCNTNDMIFSVAEIISFLSGSNTLVPGTVILTGTPHGVGMAAKPPRWLKAGDEVTIEIDGIGRLTNPVIEEKI